MKHVLEIFLQNSATGFHSDDDNSKDDIENSIETLMLDKKYLRLCKIKDRYYAVAQMLLRDRGFML